MMILFVVPKLPTDPKGEKYYRVQHHHAEGLTYSTCIINGIKREVYSTSRIKPVPHYGKTILVHCKPLKVKVGKRLKCADIPTAEVLKYIDLYKTWPTAANYRQWTNVSKFDHVRLAKRKEDTLVHRGYVTQYDDEGIYCDDKAFLTPKGKHRLQRLEQQNA
jgi:hypothetical protein